MKQALSSYSRISIVLYFCILLLSACNEAANKQQKALRWDKQHPLILFRAGIPSVPNLHNVEQFVAGRWGFQFKQVADCMITQHLRDSIEEHNRPVMEALNKKYGKDWYHKFNKQVEAALLTEKKVIALLDKQKLNIDKRKALQGKHNSLNYFLIPVNDNLHYYASAEALVKFGEKYYWLSYYRYTINLQTSIVKLAGDNIIKR